jgi:HPt (histidine-containing phosphotransfer) domain-containing protein
MNDIENEEAEPALKPFAHEFLTDRLKEQETLSKYIDGEDFDAIRKLAHTWKGYSAPYGFHTLATLSRQLEEFSEGRNINECKNIFAQVKKYLDYKKRYWRKQFEGSESSY